MGRSHEVRAGEREGFATRELVSPEGVVASFAPAAGMVCCSLRQRGAEFLGQRKGLRVYAQRGSTMGIPLLHPWANRLARWGFALRDVRVAFPASSPRLHDDGRGLPIHGLLAGVDAWRVELCEADARAARLSARLDFAAQPELAALFPFPHELRLDVALAGTSLAIGTTLRATGARAVPVAFGWHPYFRIPDAPRRDWEVELPARRRLRLDAKLLPTGESEPAPALRARLGDTVHDDLYCDLGRAPVFALAGGGRRIEVAFGEAYRHAIVYAPANDEVVCFEPMTAPTNPFEGAADLAWVEPGRELSAEFSVTLS
jgi:galactose mutarotase-like enzyme